MIIKQGVRFIMQHFIYNNKDELVDIKNINNIDWDKISKDYKLSEEFIEKYKNKVNW